MPKRPSPPAIVALCCLALSVLLSGCYETVSEKQAREKLEQRIKAIENELDRPRSNFRLVSLQRSTSAPAACETSRHSLELEPMEDQVKKLIEKAEKAAGPGEAMNYAQAALNAANALRALNDIKIAKRAH